MKKRYITHIDRTWKGKEWWGAFMSHRPTRLLTDEEAATLDNIEEVFPLKEFSDCLIVKDGRMSCTCGSKKGFYVYKMHRGKRDGWYEILKCADCGARQKRKI